jgi:hypothetical protein
MPGCFNPVLSFSLRIFAERQGFEPWIPVSQDTHLAGERLRPTRPPLRIQKRVNFKQNIFKFKTNESKRGGYGGKNLCIAKKIL